MKNIAIIGCGKRMSGGILRELARHKDMRVSAIADPRVEELREQFAGQDIRFYPCIGPFNYAGFLPCFLLFL